MAEFHPITEFARSIQHSLIPEEKRNRGLRPSLAFTCTQIISNLTLHEEDETIGNWLMKEVGARVGVLAMPFFVSLSALQLGGAFVCHVTLMTLTWEWDFDLLYEDLIQTALMVVDIFAQVFVCPISIIDPRVYELGPPSSPVSKDQVIKDLEQEIWELKLKPVISPKSRDVSQIRGVTLKEYTDQSDEVFSTWKIDQSFDQLKSVDAPQKTQINSIEKFLCPQGTFELTINFQEQPDSPHILMMLNKTHQVDRLVLSHPDSIDFLKELSKESTLSMVHTLVIQHCGALTKESLEAIAAKFPNIACFGLETCIVDDNLDDLAKNHILLWPKIARRASFQDGKNNVQEQFDSLNEKLFNFVKDYKEYDEVRLTEHFPDPSEQALFHPAAPFIRRVEFLRKTPIRDSDLKRILPRMSYCFRNMEVLNLSYCKMLTVDTVLALHQCRAKQIFLANCSELIRYKRLPDGQKGDLTREGRPYKDFSFAFAVAIAQLYLSGVDVIRFDSIEGLKPLIEGGINPVILQLNKPPFERSTKIVYHNGNGNVRYPPT